MAKLSDYQAAKDKLKKTGFNTGVFKDDFQDKFKKYVVAGEKLAEVRKEYRDAADEVRKTATAYKELLIKWERENASEKVKVQAAGELATWLEKLEQNILMTVR